MVDSANGGGMVKSIKAITFSLFKIINVITFHVFNIKKRKGDFSPFPFYSSFHSVNDCLIQ